jgi:hypothetical protein
VRLLLLPLLPLPLVQLCALPVLPILLLSCAHLACLPANLIAASGARECHQASRCLPLPHLTTLPPAAWPCRVGAGGDAV